MTNTQINDAIAEAIRWTGGWLTIPDYCREEIVEHVCPQCKWVSNSLSAACHAYGCRLPAEAGEMWPDAVYRWSCHAHSRWMSDKRKETNINSIEL